MTAMQSLLRLVYPAECLICRELTDDDHALCGACWRDTPFIGGLSCDTCGIPLAGSEPETTPIHCDDCMVIARPWARGRSTLLYRDNGRKIVLSLKHGDREDLVSLAAKWMLRAGQDVLTPGCLIVPVPLHWRRLFVRRYNQSAVLAREVGRLSGLEVCVDALVRRVHTASLKGQSRDERFRTISNTITSHPRHTCRLNGAKLVLIDDVMTSGATLAACAEAAFAAGAGSVDILTLARAGKDT